MQANSRCTDHPEMAQRAIIRQVRRTDHRKWWSLALNLIAVEGRQPCAPAS